MMTLKFKIKILIIFTLMLLLYLGLLAGLGWAGWELYFNLLDYEHGNFFTIVLGVTFGVQMCFSLRFLFQKFKEDIEYSMHYFRKW